MREKKLHVGKRYFNKNIVKKYIVQRKKSSLVKSIRSMG